MKVCILCLCLVGFVLQVEAKSKKAIEDNVFVFETERPRFRNGMMIFRDQAGHLWPSYLIGRTEGSGELEMKGGVPQLRQPIQTVGMHSNRITSIKYPEVMPRLEEGSSVSFTLLSLNETPKTRSYEQTKGNKTQTVHVTYYEGVGEFSLNGRKLRKQMQVTVSANDRDSKTPLLLMRASCELTGKELKLKTDTVVRATVEFSGIDSEWQPKKRGKKR